MWRLRSFSHSFFSCFYKKIFAPWNCLCSKKKKKPRTLFHERFSWSPPVACFFLCVTRSGITGNKNVNSLIISANTKLFEFTQSAMDILCVDFCHSKSRMRTKQDWWRQSCVFHDISLLVWGPPIPDFRLASPQSYFKPLHNTHCAINNNSSVSTANSSD